MTSTARTDVHRPSAPEFDPQDYDCAGVFDLHSGARQGLARASAVNRLREQGYTAADVHPMGQCSHCGAYLRYTALVAHQPTMTYLWIGEQCLDNRFESLTKAEFAALRKAAALNRERMAKAERIAALVQEHPLLADLTYPQITAQSSCFVSDIAWKLGQYGELSERQITAVESALLREIERRVTDEQRAAERAAELATAQPAPTGRVVVTGKVLSLKETENDYGIVWKMLVQAIEGYRVWVTVPRGINPDRGDWVCFTATLSPKTPHWDEPAEEIDPFFAIGKRPTKAEIITTPTFS